MRIGRVALINLIGLIIIVLVALIVYYLWHQSYYFYSTDDAQVTTPTANIAALRPGVVTGLAVAPGQSVNKGATVVTLRPVPAAAGGSSGGGSSSGGSSSGSSGGNSSSGGSSSGSSGSSGGSGSGGLSSSGGSGGGSGGATPGGVSPSSANASGSTGNGGTIAATAPIPGAVTNVTTQPGQVVQPGQPLAQVSDLNGAYITANVDEKNISDVHVGQGVDVTVDAVGGTTFHGHVSQIVPTAASALSLLPPNNYASGNYTKVSQRIPIQIVLDGLQGKLLLPGTSANVTIHIHE